VRGVDWWAELTAPSPPGIVLGRQYSQWERLPERGRPNHCNRWRVGGGCPAGDDRKKFGRWKGNDGTGREPREIQLEDPAVGREPAYGDLVISNDADGQFPSRLPWGPAAGSPAAQLYRRAHELPIRLVAAGAPAHNPFTTETATFAVTLDVERNAVFGTAIPLRDGGEVEALYEPGAGQA